MEADIVEPPKVMLKFGVWLQIMSCNFFADCLLPSQALSQGGYGRGPPPCPTCPVCPKQETCLFFDAVIQSAGLK